MAVNIPKKIENTRDNDHGWLLYTFPSEKKIMSKRIADCSCNIQCTEVVFLCPYMALNVLTFMLM